MNKIARILAPLALAASTLVPAFAHAATPTDATPAVAAKCDRDHADRDNYRGDREGDRENYRADREGDRDNYRGDREGDREANVVVPAPGGYVPVDQPVMQPPVREAPRYAYGRHEGRGHRGERGHRGGRGRFAYDGR